MVDEIYLNWPRWQERKKSFNIFQLQFLVYVQWHPSKCKTKISSNCQKWRKKNRVQVRIVCTCRKIEHSFFIVWDPFIYVPVSRLPVIIQNAGLHQTIQNNRGLTKTIPKTMPYRCLQDHANDRGRSFYQCPFGQPQILTSPRIFQEVSCFWPFQLFVVPIINHSIGPV